MNYLYKNKSSLKILVIGLLISVITSCSFLETPPDFIKINKIEVSQSQIALQWEQAKRADSYVVEVSKKNNNNIITIREKINSSSSISEFYFNHHIIKYLQPNTSYIVKIYGVNISGAGPKLTKEILTTSSGLFAFTKPLAVKDLSLTKKNVSATNQTINFVWQSTTKDNKSGGLSLIGYEIHELLNNDKYFTTKTQLNIPNINNQKFYKYNIFQITAFGKSKSNNIVIFPTFYPDVPKINKVATVPNSSDKLKITWENSKSSNIAGYQIAYRVSLNKSLEFQKNLASDVNKTTISDLNDGYKYIVYVVATNKNGNKRFSAPVFGTTLKNPSTPIINSITPVEKSSNKLELTWSPPVNPGTTLINNVITKAEIKEYEVIWYPNNSSSTKKKFTQIIDKSKTKYILNNLLAGVQYIVIVKVRNSANLTEKSHSIDNIQTGTTLTVPYPPDNIKLLPIYGKSDQLQLKWQAPIITGTTINDKKNIINSKIAKYIIKNNNNQIISDISPNIINYIYKPLKAGTKYQIYMATINDATLISATSKLISGTTLTPPFSQNKSPFRFVTPYENSKPATNKIVMFWNVNDFTPGTKIGNDLQPTVAKIINYKVSLKRDTKNINSLIDLNPINNSYSFIKLPEGIKYKIWFLVSNDGGLTYKTEEKTVFTLKAPSMPTAKATLLHQDPKNRTNITAILQVSLPKDWGIGDIYNKSPEKKLIYETQILETANMLSKTITNIITKNLNGPSKEIRVNLVPNKKTFINIYSANNMVKSGKHSTSIITTLPKKVTHSLGFVANKKINNLINLNVNFTKTTEVDNYNIFYRISNKPTNKYQVKNIKNINNDAKPETVAIAIPTPKSAKQQTTYEVYIEPYRYQTGLSSIKLVTNTIGLSSPIFATNNKAWIDIYQKRVEIIWSKVTGYKVKENPNNEITYTSVTVYKKLNNKFEYVISTSFNPSSSGGWFGPAASSCFSSSIADCTVTFSPNPFTNTDIIYKTEIKSKNKTGISSSMEMIFKIGYNSNANIYFSKSSSMKTTFKTYILP
jgi:hypothetical protein